LLAGYVDVMGGSAEQEYVGAGAALSGGVAVSPDGKLLAAAGERATLVLFDTATGALLRRLDGHDPKGGRRGTVQSLAIDPQGRWLFSGGEDGHIIRWSLPAGEKLGEWKVEDRVGGVVALALTQDGAILASGGGSNGNITLWSVPHGKVIATLKGHDNSIGPHGLAFSRDGYLASASYDKTARIWDLNARTSRILKGHTDDVEAVAFSPDGKWLATASDDSEVILWDAGNGKPRRHFRGHHDFVFDITFSADGSQLLSASRDATLRLWDVASGVTLRIYQGHTAGLWSVATHGNTLYTAASDTTVRRWPLGLPNQWVWATMKAAMSAAIAPNGSMVAVGQRDGGVRLYRLPSGEVLGGIEQAHTDPILRMIFKGDSSLLATSAYDGTAKLWRVHVAADNVELAPMHTMQSHSGSVQAVAFSPDGQTLATAGGDGKVGLFDVASAKERSFAAHEGGVASVAFSPEGCCLLSAGAGMTDFRLRLWDLADPTHIPRELSQQADELMWATLRPDGREVAAVGRGASTVSLHSLDPSLGASRSLMGHKQTVFRAIYTPDGRHLATASTDMTVRMWDPERLRLLFALRVPTEFQWPAPLRDFDFRCTAAGECWIAVPLTMGRVAVYRLPYEHYPG
ncbi:MAG: PD40 domain-containing protein, partial [Burkholderiales bacterium]|nr:PD40 domain-containing protein [Burkholderiales bacterium]